MENPDPKSGNSSTNKSIPKSGSNDKKPIPEITLPKGGGAIKGIEEKFQANPVTGSASVSIPIPASPSRNGLIPEMQINYDSGSGNSVFGLGWSLSMPCIRRKTEKQLPQYDEINNSDIYIISGAEDLVPVLQFNGSEWEESIDIRNENGETFTVKKYRPRIEGLFARIEKWTSETNNRIHWKTISKDNIISVYGLDESACISDPLDSSKIFCWYLQFTLNSKGDLIVYNYKKEDAAGVDFTATHEKNRYEGGVSKYTNTYLKTVNYGNTSPYFYGSALPTDFLFSIVFDFGEHHVTIPTVTEVNSWIKRTDAFSDYKAGFEIRTNRLCKRVLLFHHFSELPINPYAVKSLDLTYGDNQLQGITFLMAATMSGNLWDDVSQQYATKSLPPLTFRYQEHAWNFEVKIVDDEDLINAPAGIDDVNYRFTDLFSEGLSGILTESAGEWFYKNNLGNGDFSNGQIITSKPSLKGINSGDLQLQDLENNGKKYLVSYNSTNPGYFELTPEEEWLPFQTFESLPNINLFNSNLKYIDINGDGIPDIAIDEDNVYSFYLNKGTSGYDLSNRIYKSIDEEKGLNVIFNDVTQSIFLADMNGDGLTDIVRIRNGEICYWSNLGYGNFSAKITMDASPIMDSPDHFNPAYIRLADLDGSGTADLIYLGENEFRFWLNLNGNEFLSVSGMLPAFPAISPYSNVQMADILGNGLSCIVWSTTLPGNSGRHIQYVDLLNSKKPHLMIGYSNNMGKEIYLEYTPSTKFYLDAKKADTPWVTKLPFPVHCLSKVISEDKISETRFTNHYIYHHGYYDHEEREFRGFGRVDTFDTEEYDAEISANNSNLDDDFFQPPIVTRTWYHTGAWIRNKKILDHYREEYYQNTVITEHLLKDAVFPESLTADEFREAHRACKGMALRQEIYSMDGTSEQEIPFAVTEHNCIIHLKQPAAKNPYAVFLVTESESITYNYERNESDPRIAHSFNTDIDEYGNIRKSVAIVYPRLNADPTAPAEVNDEQDKMHITLSEISYTNDLDTITPPAKRLRIPYESKLFELTGITPLTDYFSLEEISDAADNATEINYHDTPSSGIQKRLLNHVRNLFLSDDTLTELPLATIESLALPSQSFSLAFTPDLVTQLYNGKVTDTMLQTAGYVHSNSDTNWWIPGNKAVYTDPHSHFYLASGMADPFGNESKVFYDVYDLVITESVDALSNSSRADIDYRTLSPYRVTDINNNVAEVETDALGMVNKTALIGKSGSGTGDSLSDPTTVFDYDLFNYINNNLPVYAHSKAREKHGSSNPRWQESYIYSDGSGNIILTKVQAEEGEAWEEDGLGNVTLVDTTPNLRWVGNGRTILNNKGKPVKQFEPYFSTNSGFEKSNQLVQRGVTPVITYDSTGRAVRTDFPNGTFSSVEFDAWKIISNDPNDNVLQSQWYDERINGSLSTDVAENAAAVKTADHAGTPGVSYLDSLGRNFYSVEDNGFGNFYPTYVILDIEGAQKEIIDARNNSVFIYNYDITGNKCYQKHHDSGQRWILVNVLGNPFMAWDERDHEFTYEYDILHRPLHTFIADQGNSPKLYDKIIYGEGQTSNGLNDTDANLRGRVYMHYDTAGLIVNEQYDFKGNLISGSRTLLDDYTIEVDWNTNPALQGEVFRTQSSYDALNRPVKIIAPDNSVISPVFTPANLLNKIYAQVQGTGSNDEYVKNIEYNERGQRIHIHFGNAVVTNNTYDPKTYRVTNIRSTSNSGANILQDLTYTYDPVGNITQIKDDAQQTLFYSNAQVAPLNKYTYDALYRLIEAEGREHIGTATQSDDNFDDLPKINQAHRADWTAMQNYTQQYSYDALGNILQLIHLASNGSFTRDYNYDTATNRLLSTVVGGSTFSYSHHPQHGFINSMPHLSDMKHNFKDELWSTVRGGDVTHYVYDSGGNRIRKVTNKSGGLKEERIYLGGVEIFRRSQGGNLLLERQTLHVMDDTKRVAIVDTVTVDNQGTGETTTYRFQLDNNLGSACIELDHNAEIITYEEYHPFGTTSYHAINRNINCAAKRYKYTSKERDEESGLYYYGARYYAPWLCRFISVDPAGIADGLNVYAYSHNNPVRMNDPTGMGGEDTTTPTSQTFTFSQINGNNSSYYSCTEYADECGDIYATSEVYFQSDDTGTLLISNVSTADSSSTYVYFSSTINNSTTDSSFKGSVWELYKIMHPIEAGVIGGVGNFLYDTVEGIGTLVGNLWDHPLDTIGGIIESISYFSPTNYSADAMMFRIGIFSSISESYNKFMDGDAYTKTSMITYGITFVASFFVGAGEANTAAKTGELGQIANIGSDVAKVPKLTNAANKIEDGANLINFADDAAKGVTNSISKIIDVGKQGKHIVGHNNYMPGKSILTENAQGLLDAFHSGSINSSQIINEVKTRVNFGKTIGNFVKDGVSTPTTNGIIINAKNGVHIVPSAPF